VEGALATLGLERVVERHDVFREWPERVGEEIARVARPHRVDGDKLIVRVASSVWLNELSLRQTDLLRRLNKGRRHGKFQRLIFRLDPNPEGGVSPGIRKNVPPSKSPEA
jgi:predicted nucleic acid-binding Zn ribbon protein